MDFAYGRVVLSIIVFENAVFGDVSERDATLLPLMSATIYIEILSMHTSCGHVGHVGHVDMVV